MAKGKGPQGVQNRHIYSRASYLYQAATYLAAQHQRLASDASKNSSTSHEHSAGARGSDQHAAMQNMSRHMVTGMRAVSLKAQIRQSPAVKRTICKFCDTLLVPGQSCTSVVENASKGGKKPWADVLKIQCKTCGNVKRYPVGAPRQKRRALRQQAQQTIDSTGDVPMEDSTPAP